MRMWRVVPGVCSPDTNSATCTTNMAFRALTAKQCQYLANLPLQDGIDWDVFRELDFDAMAERRRTRGRRPK